MTSLGLNTSASCLSASFLSSSLTTYSSSSLITFSPHSSTSFRVIARSSEVSLVSAGDSSAIIESHALVNTDFRYVDWSTDTTAVSSLSGAVSAVRFTSGENESVASEAGRFTGVIDTPCRLSESLEGGVSVRLTSIALSSACSSVRVSPSLRSLATTDCETGATDAGGMEMAFSASRENDGVSAGEERFVAIGATGCRAFACAVTGAATGITM